MPVHVALLRAINLGPRNRVAMPELRAALERSGFTDVVTHLHTGNVVLRSAKRSAGAVESAVEGVLRADLGVEVDVIVRTAAQMAAVAREHPLGGPDAGPKALHVGFLKTRPEKEAVARLEGRTFGRERSLLRGGELFLLYPDGMGRSKMNGAFFERALGVALTVRSVAVVRRVSELAQEA